MAKSYRSDEARKLAEQRKEAERKRREQLSKKFADKSNPHHGAEISQSGHPKRGKH